MPRTPQVMTGLFPYHVTARSNNKEWFYIPKEQVWRITTGLLSRVSRRYSAEVIAFVLMANHFHLLIHAPLANLDQIMNYFQREVSKAICKISGRINHIFGGRYKSSLIRDPRYFAQAYKYVYRNPVEAGLVDRCEDYPFSTLFFLVRGRSLSFPLMDIFNPLSSRIPIDLKERLEWMNTSFPEQHHALIQNALRRVEYGITKDRNMRMFSRQLMEEY